MINKKNIRDYEVSIWTLQDSFITILKPSHLENKGMIQEPKMVLKDDGENSFSFKIPMYIYEDTNLEEEPYFKKEELLMENPIWFNVRNGNLLVDMRKIKVIFNKKTEDEEIFEFIITNIKESHEGFSKYCEVTCGGLAFHELGKQGYNITLSENDFFYEYEEWIASGKPLNKEPIENINYWIEKVLKNSNWGYEIQMDWSLYDPTWNTSKVYKEPYVSSWKIKDNILIPEESVFKENQLEKVQPLEEKESNRYNLLQKIAETFQVYCKYKYYYDDNYHIIDRKVIFYNNFLSDKEEIIDFTYGYNTSQITREIDSMDLVTKMFVKPMKDSGTFSGEIKLSDSAANKSLENYLLNFDYLYKIGTITQDQYEEVKNYEKELHEINSSFLSNSRKLIYYTNQLPIEEAKKTDAESLIENSQRRINKAKSEEREIANGKSSCSYTSTNPLPFILIKPTGDESNPYITLQSVFGELNQPSFQLYTEILSTGEVKKESEIKNNFDFTIKNGLVTKITIKNANLSNVTKVYATFKYKPNIPSQKVQQLWLSKQKQAEKEKAEAEAQLLIINGEIDSYTKQNKSLKKRKQEIINNFERFMGPAIREGTWNPEDSYSNCQTNEIFELDNSSLIKNSNTDRNNSVGFIWSNTLFEGEYEISYPYGLDTDTPNRYYPCINLSGININSLNGENLNLVYRDYYWGLNDNDSKDYQDPTKNHYLALGAEDELKLVFLRNKIYKNIIPALIVLGVRSLLDEEDDNGKSTTPYSQVQKNARLSTISYESNGDFIETVVIKEDSLKNLWIGHIEDYEIVYPRFYNSSLKFLTTTPENMIYYGDTALEKDKDYYMLFRADKDEDEQSGGGHLAHYLTLKPESIMFKLDKKYSFHYSLSTAADAIYLDALKILKENSTPKVSYSLTPLAKDESFIKKAYNRIGQLVHINDIDLKFENVQGYISEVNLSLDKPWEDNYTVKNYKTKFEDLFSTIVAQTQAMQRNSQTFTMASNLFDNNGYINSDLLNKSINKAGNEIEVFETVAVTEEAMFARIEEQLYKVTSDAALILNGNIGLAFPATDTIDGISLNNQVGLRIDGTMKRVKRKENGEPELIDGSYLYDDKNTIESYFRVTNGAMGFFKKGSENEKDEGMMYFDALTGDMALKGTLWAKAGGFGVVLGENDKPSKGWLIETGTFKSLNGRATFTSGGLNENPKIILKGDQNQEIFKFDGENLTITGVITAKQGGNIAGWIIGDKALYKEDDKGNEVVGIGPGDSSGDISFWAGGPANDAPFKVTNGGALTATNADITGAITATSGTIGQTNAPKINIGSTSDASTSPSWIYSGSKKSKNFASDGFYIGTDGISLGEYDSKSGHNPFEISTSGILYATGATISGALTATSLTVGNSMTYSDSDGLKIGTGNNSLEYKNSKLTIKGSITATSGSIGSTSANQIILADGVIRWNRTNTADTEDKTGFYLSKDGLFIGNKNKFKVTATGAVTASDITIKGGSLTIGSTFSVTSAGYLTATSGSIGGWYIGSNYLGSADKLGNSVVGISNRGNSDYAFWAGGVKNDDNSLSGASFSVTKEGALTAAKANITGGEINLSRTEDISYTIEGEELTYNYNGAISLNQRHSETIENITRTVPFTLYLRERINYGKDEETGRDRITNYKMFYHEGALDFRETDISNGTSITAGFIFSKRFSTKKIDISDETSSIAINNGSLGLEMIGGTKYVGLRTYNTNEWIIYKSVENNKVYIKGNVYVENGAGGWKKISG